MERVKHKATGGQFGGATRTSWEAGESSIQGAKAIGVKETTIGVKTATTGEIKAIRRMVTGEEETEGGWQTIRNKELRRKDEVTKQNESRQFSSPALKIAYDKSSF